MKGSTPTWLGVDQDTAELPPLVSGTGAPARRVTWFGLGFRIGFGLGLVFGFGLAFGLGYTPTLTIA